MNARFFRGIGLFTLGFLVQGVSGPVARAQDRHPFNAHDLWALDRISESPIKELLVSDSIDLSGKELPDKIRVLTVATLLTEAIARISNEESLSSLFGDYV